MNYRIASKQFLKCNFQSTIRIICSTLLILSISGCGVLYSTVLVVSCGIRPDLNISPDKLPKATVGKAYHVVLSVSKNQTPMGALYLYSGQLPAGLEFVYQDDNSGEANATIEGIPTEVGYFPIVVKARSYGTQCSGQTGIHEYAISVATKLSNAIK